MANKFQILTNESRNTKKNKEWKDTVAPWQVHGMILKKKQREHQDLKPLKVEIIGHTRVVQILGHR